jgi:hypothetical protein
MKPVAIPLTVPNPAVKVPEFQSWSIIALLVVAMAALIIIRKRGLLA